MATKDDETTALAHRGEPASARSTFDVLIALQEVARAELAKGPGLASTSWQKLHNVIAEALGEEPLPSAATVVGRQPMMMPPGFKNPIPAKGGAIPVRPDQGVQPSAADIRKRADVAAELERVKRGGR